MCGMEQGRVERSLLLKGKFFSSPVPISVTKCQYTGRISSYRPQAARDRHHDRKNSPRTFSFLGASRIAGYVLVSLVLHAIVGRVENVDLERENDFRR